MSQKTYDDFMCLGVNSLKDYLTIRGISVTGYKKAELVARAFSAAEMGLPIILSSEEQTKLLHSEYEKRLHEYNLPDPLKISTEDKTDDIKIWPPINLGIIFEYILNVRDFNTEYIGKYKDQKAYSYFDSGFVGEILSYKTDNFLILFCSVRASMSIHEEKELWIATKLNGNIITAWCSCMAGASKCCNHIIATLYKLEYANTNGYRSPACTSVPCGWNKSTKIIIEPKKISEIIIRKKIRSKLGENPGNEKNREEVRMIELNKFDPREQIHQTVTGERVSVFLNDLFKTNPTAVIFKSVEGMSVASADNLTVTGIANEILASQNHLSDDDKITVLLRRLIFSEEEAESVENKTRGQTKSTDWFDHRKGRLTASKHHELCTKVDSALNAKTQKPKTTHMVANILYNDVDLSKIDAVKWGRDHEETALKQFYAIEATKHIDFKLQKAGLFIDKNMAYIGASPDSIMFCKCHGKSSIEIKCPYSIRNMNVEEGAKQCDFLTTTANGNITIKQSHKYYTQVMSQIILSKSSQGFFIVWTTKDMFVQQIERNVRLWSSVVTNLQLFFKSYVVKRLLAIDPLEFCGTCNKVLFEESELKETDLDLRSICCDQCNCWHHFKCQNVTTPVDNESNWLCTSCLLDLTSSVQPVTDLPD